MKSCGEQSRAHTIPTLRVGTVRNGSAEESELM